MPPSELAALFSAIEQRAPIDWLQDAHRDLLSMRSENVKGDTALTFAARHGNADAAAALLQAGA